MSPQTFDLLKLGVNFFFAGLLGVLFKSYVDKRALRDQRAVEKEKEQRGHESAVEVAMLSAYSAQIDRQREEIADLRKYQRQLETDLRHCAERHIRMTAFCSDLNALVHRLHKQAVLDWTALVKSDPERERPRIPDVPPMPADDFDHPKPSGQRMQTEPPIDL